MPTLTTLPEPAVQRRWKKLSSESNGDGGDPYTGYDRFGRWVHLRWFKEDPTPVPLVNVKWGYNRASLKTWRQDVLATSLSAAQDQHFIYDGLYQVSGRQLGVLNGSFSGITGTPVQAEDFTYDETGNWVTYEQSNGGTLDIDQSREHNTSNQITEIDEVSSGVDYDANGNMLRVPTGGAALDGSPRKLVWDAWNRLRRVSDDADNVLAEYEYDAKTRRTVSLTATTRHTYYNDQWRSVEERLGSSTSAERQQVWHPMDRWELLLRDRSTADNGTLDERLYSLKDQLDPVAICDASGEIQERYAYSAFGRVTVLDEDFVERTVNESDFDWNWLFHGEFRDEVTSWYNYGYRYYVADLGRWISRDPIGESGGVNLYNALNNNFPDYYDYFGLFRPGMSDIMLIDKLVRGGGGGGGGGGRGGMSRGTSGGTIAPRPTYITPPSIPTNNPTGVIIPIDPPIDPPDKWKDCKPCEPAKGSKLHQICKPGSRVHGRHSQPGHNCGHVKVWTVLQSPWPKCKCNWSKPTTLEKTQDPPSGSVAGGPPTSKPTGGGPL